MAAKKSSSLSRDPGKGLMPKLRTMPLGAGEIPGFLASNSPTARKQEATEKIRVQRSQHKNGRK